MRIQRATNQFMHSGTGAAARLVTEKALDTINVKDFAAVGDETNDDTDAINDALAQAGTSNMAVFLPPGKYVITDTLVVPAGVLLYGVGRASKIVSAITVATPNAEMVRLSGDFAAIADIWLHGPGQGDGTYVDGTRGIWIGSLADHLLIGMVNHCTVENVWIDETIGNGICGDFEHCEIINVRFINTTDAGIHLQPHCNFNRMEGCRVTGSWYSGIDNNGANNNFTANWIWDNGGGVLDLNSWNGILLANVFNSDPCEFNVCKDNHIWNNAGSGIAAFGSTGALINPARGNKLIGNTIWGHTTTPGSSAANVPAGISLWGGDHTLIEGNTCFANQDNYLISGAGAATHCKDTIVANNFSFDATRNGYLFVHSPREDMAGDFPPLRVSVRGNFDRGAAAASFKFQSSGLTFDQYTIKDNRSHDAGTYAFQNVTISSCYDYHFENNYGSSPGTAYQTGFDARNQAGATPDVVNGRLFRSINGSATTVTAFTGGIAQQEIIILCDGNTTYDFSGTTLKGNKGVDYTAAAGDWLTCIYDGTNWYCDINTVTGFPVGTPSGVTQGTSKTTAVTVNAVQGAVTTHSAALAADAQVVFTMNNNRILSTNDRLRVQVDGGPNYGSYVVQATVTGVGTADISLRNVSAGSLSDAVIIGFELVHQ